MNEPEVIRAAIASGAYNVVLTAYNFRQPHAAEVEKAIDEAAKAGLGIIAMKTQAGVFWDRERQHPINMKAALKWVLRNENVHTAVPGFTTFEQMEIDLSVMEDSTLTPAEELDLRKTSKWVVVGCTAITARNAPASALTASRSPPSCGATCTRTVTGISPPRRKRSSLPG